MFEIQMPQAGQSMEEGTVVRWLKQEGDAVATKDILLEVETDKAVVEVEAGHNGILRKILVPAGVMVPVHTRIGWIGEAGEAIPADTGTPLAPAPVTPLPPAAASLPATPATPLADAKLTDILMPQAGQSMEEGTIVRWLKKEGDAVKPTDILLEVETDKALIEVEAGHEGVLSRILAPAGTTVPVRSRIALLGTAGAALPPVAAATASATPSGTVKASPAARRLAGERGIDLATLGTGSGPYGRITSRDLPATGVAASQPAPAPKAPAPAAATAPGRRKLTPMRKAIARNLQISKQNIPHFYMQVTINAAPLSEMQKIEKSKYQCSLNDFITKACAKAVGEFPSFRSRIDNDEMVETDDVNIGIAVGMDEGLVVPVLTNADRHSLRDLASETRRLVASAKSGKIENMGKGIFTITNLGMFGIEQFTAIINPPESAILAVGAARETVVVQDGAMWPGKVMTLTLSADHRVVDGLPAAKFMARLKELLENPAQLV